MQFSRRHLVPGETDHELIWLCVSAGSLLLAIGWFTLGLPWPRCAFHDLTGLPCLTCGATRCTIALLHGSFGTAWLWNPFAFLVICGIALFDIYALVVLTTRAPRLRLLVFSPTAKTFIRLAVVVSLALNWLYLLSNYKAFSA
jgi:hypothetical protein